MKTLRFVILVCVLFGTFNFANASCSCECVNGQMQALCDSAIDLPPICPPKICPLPSPRRAPLQSPTLPPIGTSQCWQEQVYNPMLNDYEWQKICQ